MFNKAVDAIPSKLRQAYYKLSENVHRIVMLYGSTQVAEYASDMKPYHVHTKKRLASQ